MSQATPVVHPVRVVAVNFPKTQFERKFLPNKGGKLLFPAYVIEVDKDVDFENRLLTMFLKVKSRSTKSAIVAFKFEVEGMFSCVEFERSEEALKQFSGSQTPLMLLWPYVRPYLSMQMQNLGLPAYYLPLVLKWKIVDEITSAEQKSELLTQE